MGFFDGFAGAALGFAGDLFGFGAQESSAQEMAAQQFEYNKALQQNQFELNKQSYLHRHRWEVADLKAAGLNPILSANSAGSVPSVGAGSVGLPQAPEMKLGKTLEAIANSALAKKQTELAEFKADTERIVANADMLRAKQEEARTASSIEVNQSQASLNIKNVEMLDKSYELHKLYNEAQVREIDQRIINSVMEVQAKVQYYKDSGEAALRSASAAESQAAAAWQNAETQRIIASVAEANGISQRALNDALSGKASAETKEALSRMLEIDARTGILEWQKQRDISHNPLASGKKHWNPHDALFSVGEILRNGISGSFNYSISTH